VGIGTAMAFKTETAAGNTETGAKIESAATNVTGTSEDFDLKFSTMAAGATAAERLIVNGDGITVCGTRIATATTGSKVLIGANTNGANCSVSIGDSAGENTDTNNTQSVAVGYKAGNDIGLPGSVSIGFCAGYDNWAGGGCSVQIGYYAGASNYYNSNLIAIGGCAGESATANNVIAIGLCAHKGASSCPDQIAIGTKALAAGSGSSGQHNIFIGHYSTASPTNKPQGYNVVIGNDTGKVIHSTVAGEAHGNTLIGSCSALALTCGSCNTMLGNEVGNSLTSGKWNTFLGTNAGGAVTTGCMNTLIGKNAGCNITTGTNDIIIGNSLDSALPSSVTGSIRIGDFSNSCCVMIASVFEYDGTKNGVAIGDGSMGYSGDCGVIIGGYAGQNQTGSQNVIIGACSNIGGTGGANVFVGTLAGFCGICGNFNTYIGTCSGWCHTGANTKNTGVGYQALNYGLLTSCNNTAVGYQAGKFITGCNNTYFGSSSGFAWGASGCNNTGIGQYSGASVTTGCYNSYVGDCAGYNVTTGCNTTAIGYAAFASSATACNEITLGNSSVTCLRVPGVDFSVSSTQGVVSNIKLNDQTGTTYTFVLTDHGKLVTFNNASAITATVPPNSSVAYPVGAKIDLLAKGAGQLTVAAGTGVTVNTSQTLNLRAQWSAASLIKLATNTWVLVGDLEAS